MSTNTDLEALRRPQIVQAALLAISELGIANVTMDDIARAAGLSKGGVAHYFSGKDALCKEAFREFFSRIFQRSRETMDAAAPAGKLLSFAGSTTGRSGRKSRVPSSLIAGAGPARRGITARCFMNGWIPGSCCSVRPQVWLESRANAASNRRTARPSRRSIIESRTLVPGPRVATVRMGVDASGGRSPAPGGRFAS